MQKVLQKLSQLVVKIDLLDNRMLKIDGNNGQNTNIVNKQQKEDAELEGLEEIFPFTTKTNLYSFDKKLRNKMYSREVVNIFNFVFVSTIIEIIYYYYTYIVHFIIQCNNVETISHYYLSFKYSYIS